MATVTIIEAKTIPAIESRLARPSVGDIGSVPAVSAFVEFGKTSVACVGLIDTGADLCALDEAVFQGLRAEISKPTEKIVVSELSGRRVPLYQLNLRLRGTLSGRDLYFTKVPVVVAPLHRPILIVGRRGVLELLRLEIDFPKGVLKLAQYRKLAGKYPSLARDIPGFQRSVTLFEENAIAEGIIVLTMEIEGLLDRIIASGKVRISGPPSGASRGSFRGKLLAIVHADVSAELQDDIDTVVSMRNAAAHSVSGSGLRQSPEVFLAAAERLVSRLAEILSQ